MTILSTTDTKKLALIALAATGLLALAGLLLAVVLFGAAVSTDPTGCQEDEACWDCSTMGSRQCGPAPVPTSEPGPPIPR
jgi:hypothetical protein